MSCLSVSPRKRQAGRKKWAKGVCVAGFLGSEKKKGKKSGTSLGQGRRKVHVSVGPGVPCVGADGRTDGRTDGRASGRAGGGVETGSGQFGRLGNP